MEATSSIYPRADRPVPAGTPGRAARANRVGRRRPSRLRRRESEPTVVGLSSNSENTALRLVRRMPPPSVKPRASRAAVTRPRGVWSGGGRNLRARLRNFNRIPFRHRSGMIHISFLDRLDDSNTGKRAFGMGWEPHTHTTTVWRRTPQNPTRERFSFKLEEHHRHLSIGGGAPAPPPPLSVVGAHCTAGDWQRKRRPAALLACAGRAADPHVPGSGYRAGRQEGRKEGGGSTTLSPATCSSSSNRPTTTCLRTTAAAAGDRFFFVFRTGKPSNLVHRDAIPGLRSD